MIDHKVDQETGNPYLMEINGRSWESLHLAVDAGVDFPNLLFALAHEVLRASVTSYHLEAGGGGRRARVLTRLTKSSSSLALPPGSPSSDPGLARFVSLWRRGVRSGILRLDDPMPLFL
jgi:hypothetical protein